MKRVFKGFIILSAAVLSGATHGQPYLSGPAEKDFAGYLFAYFRGNAVADEAVCFAVSVDGYNYRTLNGGEPVIDSRAISQTGGVRDPHILRGEDGKTFYMVTTDMTSSKGWDSNRGLVMLRSTDLVNWSAATVNIQQTYPGNEELKRVWAPQTIWDPGAGKYMVYFSMQHAAGPDIIYYAYANADFTGFESAPRVLFTPRNGLSCIDGDIIEKNGIYRMFYKTEGHGNGIRVALTDSLASGRWIEQPGYKQLTRDAVEGSSVFRRPLTDTYVLMYDVYTRGRFEFCESVDLDTFHSVNDKITMDFKPRHGSVIPVTRGEIEALMGKWGVPEGFAMPAQKNPVIAGYYADPEILYSTETGKYYLYPTSDGFDGWGGYYFKAFSSDDLVEWSDQGVFLDLKKDVSWADGNAWAPAIIEKGGKYYFYFSGGSRSGPKKIGVAVADDPAGPFLDSGKPLIDFKPEGVRGGQEIDPDVFTDPRTGKSYIYWGNGYMAGAELGRDMVSIKKNTVKVMTPDSTFREAVYVFHRNGVYYFLWSEDDTGSPNYKVRWATATSPLGPLTIPGDNIVIMRDDGKEIFGTGHCSVLQIPGTDQWRLVYHRISRPDGMTKPYPGTFREVCIEPLEFDANGNIIRVIPSL